MSTQRLPLFRTALAALFLSAAPLSEALAAQFVTGSANTNGYTVAGYMKRLNAFIGTGQFTVVAHKDTVSAGTTAIVCTYQVFDSLVFTGHTVKFHSVGTCKRLLANGGVSTFLSNNLFRISDNGVPGPGHDQVDVNVVGAGITVPGSFLVDGNFVVNP